MANILQIQSVVWKLMSMRVLQPLARLCGYVFQCIVWYIATENKCSGYQKRGDGVRNIFFGVIFLLKLTTYLASYQVSYQKVASQKYSSAVVGGRQTDQTHQEMQMVLQHSLEDSSGGCSAAWAPVDGALHHSASASVQKDKWLFHTRKQYSKLHKNNCCLIIFILKQCGKPNSELFLHLEERYCCQHT